MNETVFQVKTDVFEGPFDLLLAAINDQKIDLYRLSLSQITASFLEYWKRQAPALLTASDFIIMAAYLLELKSRGLLPAKAGIRQEEESEIEKSLIEHIQEFEVYREIAQNLRERKEIFERVYGRHEGELLEKEFELRDVSLRDLVLAFQKVYQEIGNQEEVLTIEPQAISLEERIIEIKQMLSGRKAGLPFEDLFLRKTRLEVVLTFLAILELARQEFISLTQGSSFGSILIFTRELYAGSSAR
jgi:segregation and condensation protein A